MVKFKGNRYDKTVDLSIRKDDIIVCIAFMQSKVNVTGYATHIQHRQQIIERKCLVWGNLRNDRHLTP